MHWGLSSSDYNTNCDEIPFHPALQGVPNSPEDLFLLFLEYLPPPPDLYRDQNPPLPFQTLKSCLCISCCQGCQTPWSRWVSSTFGHSPTNCPSYLQEAGINLTCICDLEVSRQPYSCSTSCFILLLSSLVSPPQVRPGHRNISSSYFLDIIAVELF